jgi:presenilin-like A22 family membrane protease
LLVLFFVIAQVVGLAVTERYIDFAKSNETGKVEWKPLPSIAGVPVERPETTGSASLAYIISALLIGTIVVLLLMRWQKVMIWKVWYFIAVLAGLYIAIAAFVPQLIAFIAALVLAVFKIVRPKLIIHNLTEILIYGGLAAIFVPLLSVASAAILLILLSAYDAYAVWQSKHMIKMAKFQASSGIFAGLLVPYKTKKVPARIAAPKMQKGARVAVLGGGDIAFPLIFTGTVMQSSGFWLSLLVVPATAASLFLLFYYGKKDRFYPAMPYLTVGCFVGYLLVRIALLL